jgi:hypothetical protein
LRTSQSGRSAQQRRQHGQHDAPAVAAARSNRYRAWPIGTAPFFAMLICAANAGTVGGIVVDGDAGDLRLTTR